MWIVHGIRKGLMYGDYKIYRLLKTECCLHGPTAGKLRANIVKHRIRGITCSCRMSSRECRSMNALHVRAQQEVYSIYPHRHQVRENIL